MDNQTHIVRMMWQGRTNRDDEATPTDEGNQESKGSTWIKPSACKSCGEIGHTSNECHDEWHHSAARHQTKGCFTSQISCFLCEATNHIPAQCQLYPIMEQVRQQVQERMHHTLRETLVTRDSKKELQQRDISHVMCFKCKNTELYANDCPEKKNEPKLTTHPYTSKVTTKCCYSCEEEGHFSWYCPIKWTRSSTFEI